MVNPSLEETSLADSEDYFQYLKLQPHMNNGRKMEKEENELLNLSNIAMYWALGWTAYKSYL